MKHVKQKIFESLYNGRLISLVALMAFGIVSRLIPHAPNFVPVTAIALFSGYYFHNRKTAMGSVILIMMVSDLLLGYQSLFMRFVIYTSLLMPVFLGSILINTRHSVQRRIAHTIGSAIGSSLFFYIVTNFAVWSEGILYPMSMEGLFLSYFFALPFLKYSLAGNLFYTGFLFGSYWIAVRLSQNFFVTRHPYRLYS